MRYTVLREMPFAMQGMTVYSVHRGCVIAVVEPQNQKWSTSQSELYRCASSKENASDRYT